MVEAGAGRRSGLLLPALFGVGGTLILVCLSVWQVQRLEWKNALVAEIDARASGPEQALPERPDPETHRYLPVSLTGGFAEGEVHVLTSRRFEGPGFRIIQAYETEGRRILVDRGFVPEAAKTAARPGTEFVTGHLHWPREVDAFTPDPNLARNIWFARDVEAMAAALETEPVLLVASAPTGGEVQPMPVTVRLRNNHLQYAITWALMAVGWLAMTVLLVLRQRRSR
ncbi:MAG: SURF1 family protein [Pseudomonadota bacterium]